MAAIENDDQNASLDPSLRVERIPRDLHPLLPYVRTWAISDDYDRSELIRNASPEARRDAAQIIRRHLQRLEQWLWTNDDTMSPEYVAFTNLLIVFHDPEVGGSF